MLREAGYVVQPLEKWEYFSESVEVIFTFAIAIIMRSIVMINDHHLYHHPYAHFHDQLDHWYHHYDDQVPLSLFSGECAEKDISFVGAIYEDFPDPGEDWCQN